MASIVTMIADLGRSVWQEFWKKNASRLPTGKACGLALQRRDAAWQGRTAQFLRALAACMPGLTGLEQIRLPTILDKTPGNRKAGGGDPCGFSRPVTKGGPRMTVPHFFQSSEQTCGAACLRMLFAALGTVHDEAAIVQHCGMTALGCTVQDLVNGAQTLGFGAALLPVFGKPDALAALSNDVPFVAMIDLAGLHGGPMFQWHFVVTLVLAQDEVTFHDPADGPDRRAKRDDFLAAWATAGYRGVRIWTP
jgi:predicted double-glycine peptidase